MEQQPSEDDPIVKKVEDNWHKICAMIIWKYKLDVVITQSDVTKFVSEEEGTSVFLDGRGPHLRVRLLRKGEQIDHQIVDGVSRKVN